MGFQEAPSDQYVILPPWALLFPPSAPLQVQLQSLLAVVLDGLQLPFRFEPPEVGLLAYLGTNF